MILTTTDVQKDFEYPIKAADLNRKILAFRDVLQNPKLDPLPLAQERYKILVAPLAKDLKAAKAETLVVVGRRVALRANRGAARWRQISGRMLAQCCVHARQSDAAER